MKYKNLIINESTNEEKPQFGRGAYRVTNTYDYMKPDVAYFYKHRHHRIGAPAFIDLHSNAIAFCFDDISYVNTEEYCRAAGMSDEDTFIWVLRFGDELPITIEGFYGDGWRDMALEEF